MLSNVDPKSQSVLNASLIEKNNLIFSREYSNCLRNSTSDTYNDSKL